MATIALPVIVSAILPEAASATVATVATAVASTAGSLIDSQLLLPALFPQDQSTVGPRMSEIDLQSASEGAPVKVLYGPQVRTKGTIVWMSDLIETKRTEEYGGGKGGDSQTVTDYTYSVDIAVAISGREIQGVREIRGDSKKLYSAFDTGAGPNVVKVGPATNIETKVKTLVGYNFTGLGNFGYTKASGVTKVHRIKSPNGGSNLDVFKAGKTVTVTGFSNGANNGTFIVLKTKTKSSGSTYVDVANNSAVVEAAGASVTVTQTLPTTSKKRVESITVYTGSTTQTADPTIEGREGTGNVPGWRNTAYVVMKGLQLGRFGNRVPQFSFIVEADTSITVGAVVEDVIERNGLTAAQVDASACTAAVTGFQTSGPIRGLQAVRPLMLAFDLVAQEIGGAFIFLPRDNLTTVTVDPLDLAAHEFEDDAPRIVRFEDVSTFALPTEVNVEFFDVDNDMQIGNQRVRRLDVPETGKSGVVNANFPIVMNADAARQIALRMLYVPWTARRTAVVQLPPEYFHVTENDILSFTAHSQALKVLVKEINRGQNFLHVMRGVVVETEAFVQAQATGGAQSGQGENVTDIFVPPGLVFEIIDIAPFVSEHVDEPGVYWAACASDPEEDWSGGIVYWSTTSDPALFFTWKLITTEAVMGYSTTVLADGPVEYFDRVNTVQVELYNGTLSNATELDVLNGANRAVLGGEVIGFTTATLDDDFTYTLSGLIRGLRNTETETAQHATAGAGERFVLLSGSPGVEFAPISLGYIPANRWFQAVADGGDLNDPSVPVQNFVLMANTLRMFSPIDITGTRNASNDVIIKWTPRSRDLYKIFGPLPIPAMGPAETYEIDILDGSTVVRTIKTQAYAGYDWPGQRQYDSYTAAQQTADGLTPGDPIDVKIYQMSDKVGRGNPGEATI
jgi:hypothetical protein